jgi:YfiH family protein
MKKISAPDLEGISWLFHGFFTREGEPKDLVTLKQIHSDKVVVVNNAWPAEQQPEGDALVTNKSDILIAVKTADCVPILFASKNREVVGAAHAGWKGAIGGVIEATIAEMEKLGADKGEIVAVIGPCIGPASYEVSEGFEKPFLDQDKLNAKFFRAANRPGHLMFDLPGYVQDRLQKAGVGTVYDVKRDTLSDEDTFYSYRRSTIRGEKDYGRQLSVIGIKK